MRKFTYPQAVKYLDRCMVFGIKPGLERINSILEFLGNPHKKTDFIHVVGTNGKTSTAIMTANILWACGIKCAYHISPHITEYTERLWYCGRNISRSRFAELLTELFPFIEKVNSLDIGGPITQFEIIAAMAFKLAYDEKLQVMVLEAGLGGRWDATNAADSKVV
ncbi:MAG: bifunctional folylpolyglutamate synthase/dihydrofolate synthase, partial [Actinobacteria bacterium]|nr:bifunctional folylpolyglutamate synthase/dihydrofolate synthase [Actinomycetota bacterium]